MIRLSIMKVIYSTELEPCILAKVANEACDILMRQCCEYTKMVDLRETNLDIVPKDVVDLSTAIVLSSQALE